MAHALRPWVVGPRAEGITYLRALSLMVKGHPRGSTSKTGGFPLPAARQPCLQWMKSSPICSATAMLFTTTVSLAWSTGHFSTEEDMLTPPSAPAPPSPAPGSSARNTGASLCWGDVSPGEQLVGN